MLERAVDDGIALVGAKRKFPDWQVMKLGQDWALLGEIGWVNSSIFRVRE